MKKRSQYDTRSERCWKHVPLWGIPVFLHYSPRRTRCRRCGILVEYMSWNLGKSTLSLPFMIFVARFAKLLPWEEVSRLLNIHWNTVQAAVNRCVEYGLEHRDLSEVLYIGIDEISRRKGHTYVTNVYDLEKGTLIWTGEGREGKTLEKFFDEFGTKATLQLKGVCCDMWAPYQKVVKARAKAATFVFDKFHIVRHLMEAVDKVRKQEVNEMDEDETEILKGSKYIFLKNPWNLTPKQKARLSSLEKMNCKITRAYLMKESFRKFWDYLYPGNARKFLKQWFWWATHSRLEPFRDFAWMLRRHEDDLMNYFKLRITAGAVEGYNRKAKVISQRAYGYRTFKNFRLALYHCMGGLPMPELVHSFMR